MVETILFQVHRLPVVINHSQFPFLGQVNRRPPFTPNKEKFPKGPKREMIQPKSVRVSAALYSGEISMRESRTEMETICT